MATTSEVESKAKDEESTVIFYKTKVVEFLGRSTPIVLQNDNGPCPLLAICNVLLLRNAIKLSLDVSEVSQQKLLYLVAERLLDSNSNLEGRDEGYVSNQQKNISDAIDLLPRLASGIDVNVLFKKIDDFEFTRECAIFDLLDIGLYHGWIVDPQDKEAAAAIGSKSYNALAGELAVLESKSPKEEDYLSDEEPVDFAAATTAALGVPSPSLSRNLSLKNSQLSSSSARKGDLEEAEEMMRVLALSKEETSVAATELVASNDAKENIIDDTKESHVPDDEITPLPVASSLERSTDESAPQKPRSEESTIQVNGQDSLVSDPSSLSGRQDDKELSKEVLSSPCTKEDENVPQKPRSEESAVEMNGQDSLVCVPDGPPVRQDDMEKSTEILSRQYIMEDESVLQKPRSEESTVEMDGQDSSISDANGPSGKRNDKESLTLNPNEIEPLYEGEECILDPPIYDYKNSEPEYEGEAILAEYSEHDTIKNFLKDNASQLTIYGLFCLQEGLKERELCVFFRNNHFSTMFKYEGELYLLVTDQGYINQQNLIWEKLNEVNGDTMYVRSDFQPFLSEDEANRANDFLGTEESTSATSTFISDHELAKELQELEYKRQAKSQHTAHQSSGPSSSKLIVGPQNSRYSPNPPQKPDSKAKEKCILM